MLAGRTLDDDDHWLAVEAADASVPLAEAPVAAADKAVERASSALQVALDAPWAPLLRPLALERAKAGITSAVEVLYVAFSWPALASVAPGEQRPLPVYVPPHSSGHIPQGVRTTQVSR